MNYLCSDSSKQNILDKIKHHPCYSAEAHDKYARIHLPVAPHCNVQCNYCNRKFDCVNESRPGVTSEVLTPELAREKFVWVKSEIAELSVVGIAGPGDALAEWELTKRTIQEIKKINADVLFCLSTNGLVLPKYAEEIVQLGIQHVTVTVNALDPEISAKIYQYIVYEGIKYDGVAAAQLLLKNQIAGIKYLTQRGVLVKINIVMIKGINDHHIPAVVKKVKELGAFVTNIMPLIPALGSNFENFPQTSMKEINELRNVCQIDIQQMRHCQQCRADAIGKLNEDRSYEFRMCNRHVTDGSVIKFQKPNKTEYKIAVTSKYGKLVDQHFGHTVEFIIYQTDGQHSTIIETRQAAKFCEGMAECDSEAAKRDQVIETLADCDAVLTMRIGYHAKEKLKQRGIQSVEFCDTVENGLQYAVNYLLSQEVEQAKGGQLNAGLSAQCH